MARISYGKMASEANRLIIRAALSFKYHKHFEYWDQYISYLDSCGWTDQEFDRETLKRIDRNWK